MNEEIDTTNDSLVASHGDLVIVMAPHRGPMPKDKALRLAAWIVAMADPMGNEFEKLLDAVRST